MPALTRLSVVNDMLACLGELPINALDEGHPMVPTALRMLDNASNRVQAVSWWFNREIVDLLPDTQSFIYVPNDTISVDPADQRHNYVMRGRRLYKPYEPSSASKYTFDSTVRCWLVREVPFDDLPVSAQSAISYAAQLDFMKAYEADPQKFQQVQSDYRLAYATLNAEHVRSADANMLHRRPVFNQLTEIGGTSIEADYWPHP